MTQRKFFLFGAGYSARALARLLAGEAEFAGTTRAPEKAATLRAAGITPIVFGGAMTPELERALAEATHLVVSAAPGNDGDPLLNLLPETIGTAMPKLEWIGYLSTVGVYGDRDGAWVDETSECRPVSDHTITRRAAENAWRAAGAGADLPVAVLRLSGIYGPGRNALVNIERGTARRIVKQGQVFNRIHVDDIAGALAHLAENDLGGVFNISDDEPSPPQDVIEYAAELMGVAPPPAIPFEEAGLSPMARSFYGEVKRVSNAKLKASGYAFHHPDYRSALDAMWREASWRGEAAS